MTLWKKAALGLVLATSIAACNDDRRTSDNTTPARDGSAVGTSGANVDRDFIVDQLEDGAAEIALGKLAAERATNPQVKEYAQMMVRDHQMAGDELKQAATRANVQVTEPADLDNDHKDVQEDLMKLSGRDFDKKYIDVMIDEHQEAVNEIERKVDDNNVEIKAWAAKTLPKVRGHLEQAKQLKEALDKAS
jgi:putative membrane protein